VKTFSNCAADVSDELVLRCIQMIQPLYALEWVENDQTVRRGVGLSISRLFRSALAPYSAKPRR
jgi:hypothetical protein